MPIPVDIYPSIMRAIDLIGQGRTKTSACDEAGISVTAFNTHVSASPELREMFDEAEQRGYDTMAEILLEIDRHPHYGSSDVAKASLISRNIQWFLSRRRPAQYGDKVVVENRITADKAIVDALNRARERATLLEDVPYEVVDTAFTHVATNVAQKVLPPAQRTPDDDEDISSFL